MLIFRVRLVSLSVSQHATRFLAATPCMAAFGTAFSNVHGRFCTAPRSCLCPLVPFAFTASRLGASAKHSRAHTSVRQRVHLRQRSLLLRAQAAGDIALPGPGGPAEEVVLPDPGLLNPSVLRSEYDTEIVSLAIPALGSILVDPLLSLVDTG